MTKAEFQQKEEDFFDKWWIELNEEDKVYCYMDLNYVELDGNGWPKIDIPVKELNEWWNVLKNGLKQEIKSL